jgi:hypothetical protein
MTDDEKALHSTRYILEDLNHEKGWEKMAEITGLPMGVIVAAFQNIFPESYYKPFKEDDVVLYKGSEYRFVDYDGEDGAIIQNHMSKHNVYLDFLSFPEKNKNQLEVRPKRQK